MRFFYIFVFAILLSVPVTGAFAQNVAEVKAELKGLGVSGAGAAQIDEAASIYDLCINDNDMRRKVECKCLATEYMKKRVEEGPDPDKSQLMGEVTRYTCRNVEGTRKMEYESCMVGTGFNYRGREPEAYCECYASKWAELFETYEGRLDEHRKSSLRFKARGYCKKDSSYK